MTMPKQSVSSSGGGQFDFTKMPQQEPSLDDLKKQQIEQAHKQLEGEKILASAKPQLSIEETVGNAVVDAVSEPFKTIGKGLSQLGIGAEIINPNKSISEKITNMATKTSNPIAGAINLATGITEIPMLIGTVPLEVIGTGLKEAGLGVVSETVNKAFQTVGNAPANAAQEISDALEKNGAAQKIRSFVDMKAAEYGISTDPLRIDPSTGQDIKEAANQATGLAAIVGLGALASGVYKGTKAEIAKAKLRDAKGKFVAKQVETPQTNEVVKTDLIPDAQKQTADLPQYFTKEEAPTNVKENFKPSSRDFKEVPGAKENIPKQEYKTLEDGTKVFLVDGNYIRNNVDIDFTMGGHDYVYPKYIPKNEIWLDKDMAKNDFENTLRHENTERQKMIGGEKYDKAHEIANKEEIKIRQGNEIPLAKPENVKTEQIPIAEQVTDVPLKQEVPQAETPIDNNASAIKRMSDAGKSPEEISKGLNVPVEDVNKVINPEQPKPENVPPDKVVNEDLINSNKPPEDIAITKQKMNDLRESVNLPELDQTAKQSIPETYDRVKTEIENGTRNESTLLKTIESGKKELDPTQTFELANYLTKETNNWNSTFEKIKEAKATGDVATETLLRAVADESLANIKRITDAASSVTSDWGRFGRFMQVQLAQDYSIARTMQRAELNAPEGKIPEVTKTKLETLSSDIVKLQEAFKRYQINQPTKTVEDFIAKAQRDYQFEQRRTKRAVTKEELKAERQNLWIDLYKQTNVAASGIPLTPEAIRTMGKLATNYIRDGIITADGLVDEFYKGFQEKVSKEDIMKALSGYGKISTMTRDEVVAKLNTAKKEMRLLLSIEDAQKGNEIPKQTRTPSAPNPRIQNLQKLLKAVTKENVDVTDAIKLKAQKTRATNNIAEYERMLKENRFEKKQRRPVIPDQQLTELKTKEFQLKKQVELELYKLQRMNRTNWEKTKEIGVDVANVPRVLLATADLSMPLRQGLPLGSAYPTLAFDAFKEMHKMAINDNYFKERMTQIEMSPNARVYEKMGIDFTGVGSDLVQLAKREESFIAAHLLNKVPGLKQVTQFSERGAVGYLNVLRQNVGDWQIKLMMEKGMTPENSLKAYQDVGKLINWGTGRSDLGWMERAPGVLNAIMFSPRNFVAKLHLMNPLEYIKLEPQARKLLMREQVATLAQGIMFLNLMKLNGAKVETDPRSADFAKAKFGDTRLDMFGGFQQNFVFLARLAYGQVKSTSGNTYDLNGKQFPFSSRLDLATRFLRGKLSPQMTIAVDALAGKDMMGNEFGKDIQQEAVNRFIPMVWQDMIDAQKSIGWGALGTTLLGFYGAGTQTYKMKPAKSKGSYNFDFNTNFKF